MDGMKTRPRRVVRLRLDPTPRPRRPRRRSAEKELDRLLRWAEQQNFKNVAEALRRVIAELEARAK
jgi:hypothetical protein